MSADELSDSCSSPFLSLARPPESPDSFDSPGSPVLPVPLGSPVPPGSLGSPGPPSPPIPPDSLLLTRVPTFVGEQKRERASRRDERR